MSDHDPDFIIVGAGAAGCTLAREIVTRGLGTVLLFESGTEPRSSRIQVPSDYLKTFGSRWDWDYRTKPQSQLGQRVLRLPAGHAVGGSTSINAMIWIEPEASDLEAWYRELGPIWSLNHVETAFERLRKWLEALCLPSLPPLHPSMQRILDQSVACGWTADSYPSGFKRPCDGIDAYRRMQDRGRRVSLWNLLQRVDRIGKSARQLQLMLQSDARVIRLLFDGDQVIGVRLASRTRSVNERRARRGVILCAGAIETPRLLMASGLGPRENLEWGGVECRVDLPELGRNLQDHLVFPLIYRRDASVPPPDHRRQARLQYVRHRIGPRSSNLAELGGFFSIADSDTSRNVTTGSRYQLHITPTHYLEPIPFAGRDEHVSFAITPLDVRSRGSLALAQPRGEWDPEESAPLSIDPNYLSDARDREDFLHTIEEFRGRIERSPWNGWMGREIFPKWRDRDRLVTYLERFASTIYHYAGTCAMGSTSTSCLNGSFQVRGMGRLWVCDASAMPRLVGCNPQASVAMMAMRLADMLADGIMSG